MGAVVIVQLRESGQELWDGEAGDGQERRCGTLFFSAWLVNSSHGPGSLSAYKHTEPHKQGPAKHHLSAFNDLNVH